MFSSRNTKCVAAEKSCELTGLMVAHLPCFDPILGGMIINILQNGVNLLENNVSTSKEKIVISSELKAILNIVQPWS